MKSRRLIWPLLIPLALLLMVGGVIYWQRWKSRPAAPAIATVPRPKPTPKPETDESVAEILAQFEEMTRSESEEEIRFRLPFGRLPEGPEREPAEIRVGPDGVAELSGGATATIQGIGVYIPDGPPKSEDWRERRRRLRFYQPDLTPIPEDNEAEYFGRSINIWDSSWYHDPAPNLGVYGILEGVDGAMMLPPRIVDRRTGMDVNDGSYSRTISDPEDGMSNLYMRVHAYVWHQTSLDIHVRLAHGRSETKTLPLKEGETFEFDGGFIRYIGGGPATSGFGYSSGGNGQAEVYLNKTDRPVHGTAAFAIYPPDYREAIKYEFLDKEGNDVEGSGWGSSGGIVVRDVNASDFENISVRLTVYHELTDVILPLEELPGLPEENRGVTDLFEVHVPYYRFEYHHEQLRMLDCSLQMDIQPKPWISPSTPMKYYPVEYENTTLGEMFEEFSNFYTPKNIIYDKEGRKIIIESSPDGPPSNFVKDTVEPLLP